MSENEYNRDEIRKMLLKVERENLESFGLITDEQIEHLNKIFDKNRKLETDDDLLELAALCENELGED